MKSQPPRARPGDYVTNDQIAFYADPNHAPCKGIGFTFRNEPCDCARERFLDANIFNVWPDPERDALRWGSAPPALQMGGMNDFVQLVQAEMKDTDMKIKEAETGTEAFKKAWKNAKATRLWNVREPK